jgi:hypothetical protein
MGIAERLFLAWLILNSLFAASGITVMVLGFD